MQQFEVQCRMHFSLSNPQTPFQTLKLSLADYRENKLNDGEISIHGNMYDIKSVKLLGDSAELLVINDYEEGAILKRIYSFLGSSKQPSQKLPKILQQLLSLHYIFPTHIQLSFMCDCHLVQAANPIRTRLRVPYLEIITPPPERG